jgi:uncharacterized protein (TIGR00255 family)
MTGFGRAEAELHQYGIAVELKSVNNRYFDCSVKLPRIYAFLEETVKKRIQAQVSRGKVDVYITVDDSRAKNITVSLNKPVAEGYLTALRNIRDEFGLKDDISVSLLTRFSEVFSVEKAKENLDEISEGIISVLDEALSQFDEMRTREGVQLLEDIRARLAALAQMTGNVEERSPQTLSEYRAKLLQRMQDVLSSTEIDEARILTEAAIFADKTDITEESVRLRSHLGQLEDMLLAGGIVGRKLDFLIQELNREVNTIGSKGNDLTISTIVVDMKAEIEKIREQAQNIE